MVCYMYLYINAKISINSHWTIHSFEHPPNVISFGCFHVDPYSQVHKRYNYMKRNINHTLKAVGQSLPK